MNAMLSDLWDLVGSYATLAEQPVWALATKDFDKEYQFDQKYLELLPKLVELASAEGSILYMDESQRLVGKLTYDMARQAKLAAAAGGHVDALEWLETRRPMKYKCTNMDAADITDAVRVWIAGAPHPSVRRWAWNTVNRYLELFYERLGAQSGVYCEQRRLGTMSPETKLSETYRIFHSTVASTAARRGDLISLEVLNKILGHLFPKRDAMKIAIESGNTAAVEWCDMLEPGNNEDHPGEAVSAVVQYNHLDTVKVLIERKYHVLTRDICSKSSNIKILQYLMGIGCILTEKTYSKAAKYGSVETLEWLQEQKCPRDMSEALHAAATNQNYPVVEYFIKADYARDCCKCTLIDIASSRGSLRMIRLCHENGIKTGGSAMVSAAENNQIPALELLKSLGAPLSADACNAALEESHYEAYLWLRKAGCPQNEYTEELLRSAPEFIRNEGAAAGSTAASTACATVTSPNTSVSQKNNLLQDTKTDSYNL